MSARLFKTLVYDKQVSLSVMETTDIVNDAIRIHGLKGGKAKTLGCLLTAAVYMAGCLKSNRGAISITIKGADNSCTVSVSGDKDLHIRGYIDGDDTGALKGGAMTVVKDDGFYRPFVGTTELRCNDVAENLMQYFHSSEQIPTAVAIDVDLDENGVCTMAGGVVMQLLPGTSDENMDRAENAMQDFVHVTQALRKFGGAKGIVEGLFTNDHEGVAIFESFPEYKCNCSREKIARVLLSMSRDELIQLCKEQGKVSVHCHYCNTDHEFNEEDVLKLFV